MARHQDRSMIREPCVALGVLAVLQPEYARIEAAAAPRIGQQQTGWTQLARAGLNLRKAVALPPSGAGAIVIFWRRL